MDEKVKEEVAVADSNNSRESVAKIKGKPTYKKWWFWVVIAFILIAFASKDATVERAEKEITKEENISSLNQDNNEKEPKPEETEPTNQAVSEDQEYLDLAGTKADGYYSDSEEMEEEEQGFNDFKQYTKSCIILEYNVLSKNPDKHIGTKVEITGKVLYIEENEVETYMVLGTDPDIDYLDDYVVVRIDHEVEIYEEDLVTVWGEIIGRDTYSMNGQEYYGPGVEAKYYHNQG